MRSLELIDALDGLVHEAGLGKRVKIDRDRFYAILDELREELGRGASTAFAGDPQPVPEDEWRQVARLFDELDEIVHSAKPVPLTDQIRVDRKAAYALLDEMRPCIERRAPLDWEERRSRPRTSEG